MRAKLESGASFSFVWSTILRIIFSRKHSTPASVLSHDCDSNIILPLSSVKNLGVILDCNLSMTDQIKAVVKKMQFSYS